MNNENFNQEYNQQMMYQQPNKENQIKNKYIYSIYIAYIISAILIMLLHDYSIILLAVNFYSLVAISFDFSIIRKKCEKSNLLIIGFFFIPIYFVIRANLLKRGRKYLLFYILSVIGLSMVIYNYGYNEQTIQVQKNLINNEYKTIELFENYFTDYKWTSGISVEDNETILVNFTGTYNEKDYLIQYKVTEYNEIIFIALEINKTPQTQLTYDLLIQDMIDEKN